MPVNSSTNSHAFKNPSPLHVRLAATLALMWLSACNSSAEPAKPTGPSPQEIEQRLLRISETALAARAGSEPPAQPWASLAAVLPDAIGKLTASAPATGHTDTAATQISKANRTYVADGQTAEVQVMDVARAPSVLLAFLLQQSASQQPNAVAEDGSKITSTNVGQHPAITRYASVSRTAHVTIAVAKRFVVELRLSPTPSIEEAARIAGALPLEAIAALATPPVTAGEPQATTPTLPTPSRAPADVDPDSP